MSWQEFLQQRGLNEFVLNVLGWKELDGKLWIPYPAIEKLGLPAGKRYRPTPNKKPRFTKKQQPMPYFLQHEGDDTTLLIVEGETDAATAAGAGFSVLGVPGATTWKDSWWAVAEGFQQIVAVLDADEAAAHLLTKLAATKPDGINFLVTAPILLRTGAHDLNDLHIRNNGEFDHTKTNLESLIETARPITTVATETEMLNAVVGALEQVSLPNDDEGDRKALCIFHKEATPSLDFGPKGYHCFSCGAGGPLRTLAALLGIVLVQNNVTTDAKYVVRNGRICSIKYTDNEILYLPLCNFQARITEEVLKDDGVEQTLVFTIDGNLANNRPLPTITVPADKYNALNWVVGSWGAAANVEAGAGVKDRLRSAIQFLSFNIKRKTIFTHLGWRKIKGRWEYLHAGGALNRSDILVEPEQESLRHFALPQTSDNPQSSLNLLNVAAPEVIIPLLAAVYRAPTCCLLYPTLTLWLYGTTGSFKSTLAALMSSHFGGPFTSENLPGSWMSTENALERALFLARDHFYVIDDYAPEKTRRAAAELDRRVDRIVRQIGNRTARSRLRADLTGRPEWIPNALAVSTGEQLPLGVGSVAARIFPIKCDRDTIDLTTLTKAQNRQDQLAEAMRGYLTWLGPQMDTLAKKLSTRFVELRTAALGGTFTRLASSAAHLALGWELLLSYALTTGCIDQNKRDALWKLGWNVLTTAAADHDLLLSEERPTVKFLRTVSAMLTQGQAYLAERTTGRPIYRNDFDTDGRMIGWVDDAGIYLLPDAAWREVNEYLRSGEGIYVTQNTLRDMLLEEGLLITDSGRKDKRIRVDLSRQNGPSRRVYVWAFPTDIFKRFDGDGDGQEETDC